MVDIYNDTELINAIKNDLSHIVNDVSKKMRDVVKQNVVFEVYAQHTPRMYKRRGKTGGFLGSWISDPVPESGDIYSIIRSDPDSMDLDAENYVHGQNPNSIMAFDYPYSSGDRRSRMAEIIAMGTDYDFYVDADSESYMGSEDNWWTRPRDYWSPSLQYLNDGGTDLDVIAAFNKRNIKFIKI